MVVVYLGVGLLAPTFLTQKENSKAYAACIARRLIVFKRIVSNYVAKHKIREVNFDMHPVFMLACRNMKTTLNQHEEELAQYVKTRDCILTGYLDATKYPGHSAEIIANMTHEEPGVLRVATGERICKANIVEQVYARAQALSALPQSLSLDLTLNRDVSCPQVTLRQRFSN